MHIILMILSSTLLFFILLLLRTPYINIFNYNLQDVLLKICFLLLLFPLPILINLMQLLLFYLFGNAQKLYFNNKEPIIVFAQQELELNSVAHKSFYFVILWFLLTCIITLYRLIPYIKFLGNITKFMEHIEDIQILSLLNQKKRLLKITSHIQLFKSETILSAFTTGILKPVIIIPSNTSYEDYELILLHELMHIKKKDVFFQLIRYICITLYWFNPLIYFMNYLHTQISELACDESVSPLLDDLKQKRYAQLILNSALNKRSPSNYYSSFFNNKSFYKERIKCIMKNKNFKKSNRRYPTIIAIFMVVLCCSPALAAPAPQMMFFDENLSDKEFSLNADTEIIIHATNNMPTTFPLSILYEKQIILNSGDIIPINTFEQPNRAICNHTYGPAKITTHQKHSDGGCTVMVYDVDRCSKCGTLKNKVFSAELNYASCPH